MKEIKFRAWSKAENKMYLPPADRFTIDFFGGVIYNRDTWADDMILMQFTGLHDKNGKEVWEGDIVKWNSNRKGKGDWKVGKIIWHEKELGFRIKENYIDFSPAIYTQLEVIGDIYTTPELLK